MPRPWVRQRQARQQVLGTAARRVAARCCDELLAGFAQLPALGDAPHHPRHIRLASVRVGSLRLRTSSTKVSGPSGATFGASCWDSEVVSTSHEGTWSGKRTLEAPTWRFSWPKGCLESLPAPCDQSLE